MSTSGLRGSSTTSLAPDHAPPSSTFFHVFPPSVVLNSPRSPPRLNNGPCAATYTTSELRGSIRILPICSDCLRPTFCQVLPPSTDLYTPSPYDTDRCALFSPVPTQTTLGFFGSMATVPIEYDASLSNTGVQVVPAFVVFHTPPDATATYQMRLSRGWTAMSEMRPDVR